MPCLLDSYRQAPNVSDSSHFSKSRSIMTPYVNVLLIELVTFIVLFVIYTVLENVLIGDKYREETEKEKKHAAFPLVDDVNSLHRSGNLTALWLFTIKF